MAIPFTRFSGFDSPPCLSEELLLAGGVDTFFQPIFRIAAADRGPRLAGFELLSRGLRGTRFESADALFAEARWQCETVAVDRLCLTTGLQALGHLPPGVRLFVNVHGATLERDPDLPEFLTRLLDWIGLHPRQLVLEIVEAETMADVAAMELALRRLRRLGIAIALDDLGQGSATNRTILAIRPDLIKLDRFLVRGAPCDPGRRALLVAYRHLARELGIPAVAEGVETADELALIQELGLDLCQGFYLARPLAAEEIADGALLESGIEAVLDEGRHGAGTRTNPMG
jgi:EAL domain-containing protein (putative c-di-GMP-specific phosphodiesterase class I)